MTEAEFKKIHCNNILLAMLQGEYDEIMGRSGISPLNMSGMPSGSGGDNSMADSDKKIDIEIEYRRIYHENEHLIAKARAYIESLPDAILRMILTHKYINCLDDTEIAADVGLSMRACDRILKDHFNNVSNYICYKTIDI